MTRVRVAGFSISLDGFGAGPEQSLENPLGKRGRELHQWFFGTRMFREMTGQDGGSDGVDEAYAHRSMDGFGAFILGRNMFGPIRGPWPDESWKGWWGNNPPYHAPTFVLTHHPRDPIKMDGGTTFIFVTEGIEAANGEVRQFEQRQTFSLEEPLQGFENTVCVEQRVAERIKPCVPFSLFGGTLADERPPDCCKNCTGG